MDKPLKQDSAGNYIVRIGHSPDPDDAFMFHAMTNGKFPTPGYHFVHELQDIETLNHRAMNQELEVSAAFLPTDFKFSLSAKKHCIGNNKFFSSRRIAIGFNFLVILSAFTKSVLGSIFDQL